VKRISTFVVLAALLALVGSQQAFAQTHTVTLVSDTSWKVFDGDPALASSTSLGFAQAVCLNASAPTNCPAGATLYGFVGTGWTADLSSIPGAVWIWAPKITGATAPAELAEYFFVRKFKIKGVPKAGTIQVAADDLAEIRVNGSIVGTTGSTTDASLASTAANSLTSFDITPQLKKGVNRLTVRGQNGEGSFAGCTDCTYSQHPAGIVLGASISFVADDEDDEDDEDDDCSAREKVRFEIPQPGVASSLWEDGTLGLSIPIANDSERTALNVTVTKLKVSGSKRLEPVSFPVALGGMSPKEIRQVPAHVADHDGHLNRQYHVVVHGRYTSSRHRCNFTVKAFFAPGASSDSDTFPGHPGEALKQRPQDAVYPPPPVTELTEPNAESPILVPPGPVRQLFPSTPTPSAGATPGGAAMVDIDVNRNSTSNNAAVPPDPNAARGTDNVVLSTFNTGISFSLDGGSTFTDVNLGAPVAGNPSRTSFFPQSDGGLCCDQVVIYVPRQNLFVWLLQYWPVSTTAPAPGGGTTTTITQPNRLRVAWATPQAIIADFNNAWTYGDLTANNVPGVSSGLGVAANEWLDYPDLAYSRDFLYVGTDRGWPDTPGSVYLGRRIVARLSLAEMADETATVVHYNFTEFSGSNGLNKTHFVQGVPDRMVVAGLDNTSTLRVFTWEDADASAYVRTVAISSITTNYTETAPDGTDWYAVSFPGNISGATYRNGQYLFAFDGGVNAPARPRAYVRLETVTPFELLGIPLISATAEYDIWNSDYAFAMAALGTQGDEVGMGLAVGGGTIGYPQFAVGYKDDFVVYTVTMSDATQISRFGDYFSVRPIPRSASFAAEAYDVVESVAGQTCAVGGCRAIARYVEFHRPVSDPG
jgi:hypothetical protein